MGILNGIGIAIETSTQDGVPSGGGGRFSNTYSLAFDGVDDNVIVPYNSTLDVVTAAHSLSFWMKTSLVRIMCVMEKGRGDELAAFIINSKIYWGGANGYYGGTVNVQDGNWHHVVLVASGTVAGSTIYIDGSAVATGNAKVQASANTDDFTIGMDADGNNEYTGNLDEIAIFNYALSASDVTSMYDSGTPNNLNDLSTPPVAWWRMGDNGSWKSPQWLLPENSNKDKYSNFSFNFDGVDDKITFSDITTSGAFTVSFWAKPTAFNVNGSSFIFGTESGNSNFFKFISATSVQFKIVDSSGTTNTFNDTTGSNDVVLDAWQNFIATRDASGNFKLYRNGVQFGSTLTNANTLTINSIGRVIASSIGYAGNINNFVYWDSVQDVAPIYNSGTPTTITGAVTHYKMGEDATFSTNWTVPDAVGSADGTSANMTIEDRVGEAPNSTSNALSYNMTESDRETDVPS